MKSILILLGSIALIAAANVCGVGEASATVKTVQQSLLIGNEEPKTVTLKITGMSCAGCANHIHNTLSKTDGVVSDEVKYPGDLAIIKYDASKISVEQIIKVIEKTGYKAEVQKEKKVKTDQS